MKRVSIVLGSILALGLAGCGSSGGGSTAASTDTATITATVKNAASGSASISAKGALTKAITESAASGLTTTIYNTDGDKLGTATTGSDGKCTVTANISDIKPESATGTTYTAQLILVASNDPTPTDTVDDATIHIETFVEAAVTEGSTTTIDLGTADPDTTLSSQATAKKADCKWGQKCSDKFTSFDPLCYFKTMQASFEDGNLSTGSGIKDELGAVRDLIRGSMASGTVKPADLGYTSWGDMMQGAMAGTLPAAAQSTLASAAASTTGVAASTYTSNYAAGSAVFGTLETVFGAQVAGGAGLTAVASVSAKGATVASKSACAEIKDATTGAAYLDSVVDTYMSSNDKTELDSFTDADRNKLLFGLMGQYKDNNTWSTFSGPACQGFMSGLGATEVDGYFTSGALDTTQIGGFYNFMGTIDTATLTSHEQQREWAQSLEGTIANTAGGFSNYCPGGVCDGDKIHYIANYYEGQATSATYDPAKVDFTGGTTQLNNQYNTLDTTTRAALDSCTGTFEACNGGQTAPVLQTLPTTTNAGAGINLAGTWTVGTPSGTNCLSGVTSFALEDKGYNFATPYVSGTPSTETVSLTPSGATNACSFSFNSYSSNISKSISCGAVSCTASAVTGTGCTSSSYTIGTTPTSPTACNMSLTK